MEQIVSFGDWLRQRRRALDLTQAELARRVGCATGTIKKIETDERRPSREIAALLATHLQIASEQREDFIRCARAELAPDRLPTAARNVPRAAFIPAPSSAEPVAPTMPPAAIFPHGIVTFLFTDIVGSTRLWEQHPELMGAAIDHHEALLRQVVTDAGGLVFKTVGDAVCAAFGDAVDAVRAALAGQRALLAEAWGSTGPLLVRMALHTGVVAAHDGDYAGLPLSRVARLLAAAHGGQILLSLATHELVREQLPSDAAVYDLGAHRLKDLSRPEQIFQLGAPDLPADFPALQTLDARRTNLLAQPTALIGRERELAQVTGLLSRPDVRLVTLIGPGGTGKTRLGMQAAAELLDSFADGVFFVDLAPISDPELVVTTIAQTLGVTATSARPADQLKAALRHQRLLLLLDNYEQLLVAAPLVAELLAAAAGLKVLVTSRAALHLSGEHEYAVPPLALPPLTDDRPFDAAQGRRPTTDDRRAHDQADTIGQYAAVQLFIQRAQAAKADFVVTNATAPAVAEICVRLGGLPLAIELAAARIKLFAPEALLARLSAPLALLTGGARDLPARQQTIRSTIDWSYHLLSVDEQALFRRLGVFVGGFSLEAADGVLRTEGRGLSDGTMDSVLSPQHSVLDGLAALLDQSLIVVLEPIAGEPRYGMLELVREYALERLRAAGEEIDVRRRHAAFFAAWVEDAQPSLRGDAMITSERLGRELGNFRAALDWSLTQAEEDALYGLRLFGSIWELWWLRYPTEGGAIAERALACASARHQDLVAAQIYNAAARLQKNPWRSTQGIALLQRSLALARQYADRSLLAEVLRHLGEATCKSDLHAATQVLEESLRICRELNDAEQEGWTTWNLGAVARMRGDLDEAEHWYQHSLAIFARLGYISAQAMALDELAMFAEQRGDNAAADGYLARALALIDRSGLYAGFSPLIERGRLACQRGDYQRALDLLRSGYDQVVQMDRDPLGMAALMWQAVCHLELGDLVAATERCRQALMIAIENRDDLRVSQIAMIVASVAVAGGRHITAARLLGCADSYLASTSYTFEYDHETDWKRLHDRALAACRAALDEAIFDAAWAAGQALTLEQAVAEALNR
ncbi:MAG TPA: tetratricopeptide repeat protein [Roseiflexaceae bacterium]|nr:tetratricopeptide repeat protein [Roseiflexaceae bacterium]